VTGHRRGWLEVAPLIMSVVAEAAWVTAIGALFAEYTLQPLVLGIPAMTLFVAAGALAARLGTRLGTRWPLAAVAVVALGGLLGWLASSGARAALLAGDLELALATNGAGWIAGLAVLRGFAYPRLPLPEQTPRHLLMLGVPALAFAALAGGVVSEPWRTAFLDEIFVDSLVFAAAGSVALALTRAAAIGFESGVDWRRNRSWFGLLVLLVVAAAAVAVPLSAVAGPAIQLTIGILLVPVSILSLIFGINRSTIKPLTIVVVAGVAVVALLALFGSIHVEPPTPPTQPIEPEARAEEPLVLLGMGGLFLLVAVIGIIALARLWMRQARGGTDDGVAEERTIDHGSADRPIRPARSGGRRRPAPTDAAAAYTELLRDIASRDEVRRESAETPAQHAGRLRVAGRGSLSLDLLAADYALSRYAGVDLPNREHARAIGRWRALRRRLGREGGR
jgi:hypothetical protein